MNKQIWLNKNYREILRDQAEVVHGSARGAVVRLAQAIGIHTTTLSQVLAGDRNLSLDQTKLAAEYFGFAELETEYFMNLVELEMASTPGLKKFLLGRIEKLKLRAGELSEIIAVDKDFNLEQKAIFYSNWFYAGLCVFASLPDTNTVDQMAKRSNLSKDRVIDSVNFLLENGLLVRKKERLEPGATSTHLESGNPLISRHHGNWRLKAMERHPNLNSTDLSYSSPMSISKADAASVREILVNAVKEINSRRQDSACEEAWMLNVDWIKF